MQLSPTLVFDGTDVAFEPNQNAYDTTFNQHIQAAKSVVPIYNLSLEGTATNNTGSLHVRILPADTLVHDSVYALIAICQDSVIGDLGGIYNYTVKGLSSFPVNIFYPDSMDTTIIFSHSAPIDKLRAVLFMQDMHSKKVLQTTKYEFTEDK